VRKAPAASIRDLAEAVVDMFEYKPGIREIGIRPGEKVHESLISREERLRTRDRGDYFCIDPETMGIDYKAYYYEGTSLPIPEEGYTSENTQRLSKYEIQELLLSVPEFKAEYEALRA
jgi:UDP-glucose 4-epimerase